MNTGPSGVSSFRNTGAQLLRFGFVGALNTLSTLLIIYLLMAIKVNLYVANAIGYICGATISFTLNRRWTFRATERPSLQMVLLFLVAMGCAYLANIATVYGCIRSGVSPYLAQLLGMPVYTLTFFVISKFLVFRKSAGDPRGTRQAP
jgi:putative flippase GtrA